MLLLKISLYCVIILLFFPVFILLIQIISASFYNTNKRYLTNVKTKPTLAILMPAHNESLVITESIKSINAQLSTDDKLVVIADNCTDDTALIAKSLGAIVVERFQKDKRGKGYALDFGLQHLKGAPPEVVIVVDADCIVEDFAIERLVAACYESQRPVQALYLMEPQTKQNLKSRISTFAWVVKNKVRPLGFAMLKLPCQLMGTGMAFLWADINMVSLASGHIVEDMKLGADLARLNKAPMFLHEAKVTSIFPPSNAAINTQRARWEHGHLSVILNEAPKLFYEAIKNKNVAMFGLACDLCVPPLAMLTLMCLGVSLLVFLVASNALIILATILLSCLFLGVFLAWFKFGRKIISFKQLCYAPIYAMLKIPLYIKFFFSRQVDWVRSKRD